jgi:2-amino-4-hydroxy-6-hydroxymethyldihydropteridine diphosphokinase
LLLHGDTVLAHPQLPRDEIEKYAFVLCPLADIAGEQQHPLLKRSYADMWRDFDKSRQVLWRVAVNL